MKAFRYHLPTQEQLKLRTIQRSDVDQIARRRAIRAAHDASQEVESRAALRAALQRHASQN
jgi:hypothetical protein